jgi:hypothetical protein
LKIGIKKKKSYKDLDKLKSPTNFREELKILRDKLNSGFDKEARNKIKHEVDQPGAVVA